MAHQETEHGLVIKATDDTFHDVVLSPDKPVLVDFWKSFSHPESSVKEAGSAGSSVPAARRFSRFDRAARPGIVKTFFMAKT
jgi:hypothetical protein